MTDARAGAARLRVVTQNLWGVRGAWELRRSVLRRGLRELEPDVVSLQEAIRRPGLDTAADLLGADFHLVYQSRPEPDGQIAAIASRWPIVDVHELDQRVTSRVDSASTTLIAEIDVPTPFGRVLVVNHLPCWQLAYEYERELQAKAAGTFIEDLIGGRQIHVILAGDLTDPPDSASVRFWTGRQSLFGASVCYRDAWESAHRHDGGATYTADNPILADPDWPFHRLDYILVRCGKHWGPTLAIKRCDRIFDEPVDGVWASDHFGVVADLEPPWRPPPPSPNVAEHPADAPWGS
jgi:endonuclease/exonuclease/phosphatase family metal-dependent hydrolase